MTKQATPTPVAQVNIVQTEVRGCIAHHAECTVKGCGWSSSRVDARKDGGTKAVVIASAGAHAKRHTDAQDVLDAQKKKSLSN